MTALFTWTVTSILTIIFGLTACSNQTANKIQIEDLVIDSSQNLNKPKLDSLFNVLSEKNKAMGSVALSKNGKIIYSKAIGYSLISDKEKVFATTDTKYRIGSITKMFTAVMIFQLVEEPAQYFFLDEILKTQ